MERERVSINASRRHLDDAGMGLPEVMIAMVLFALISLGMLYTMTAVKTSTRDTRARQVAANLAASEIDAAREIEDLFGLLDDVKRVDVGSDSYTVTRTTAWVSDPEESFTCGNSGTGGQLRYKSVHVDVTWDNMRNSAAPVSSHTVLNPNERINDPSKGTILVSVIDDSGFGSAGVSVTARRVGGGGTVTGTTDSQGCAYLLKVDPGTYQVSVSKSGFVDINQDANPVIEVGVTAGGSGSAGFQYAEAATYRPRYFAEDIPSALVSVNSETTFRSTYSTSTLPGTSNPGNFSLHPLNSGYEVFYGNCPAADPSAWTETEDPATGEVLVGVPVIAEAVDPGAVTEVDVPVGAVEVNIPNNRHLKAVSVGTGRADPGWQAGPDEVPYCASGTELRFGNSGGTTRTIYLPFGSWELRSGNSARASGSVISGSNITPLTAGNMSGNQVTLDPRVPLEEEVEEP